MKAVILFSAVLIAWLSVAQAGAGVEAVRATGEVQGAQEPGCDGEAVLAEVERRLLEAGIVSCEFRITSEGAFQAELSGLLEVRGRESVHLAAAGSFAGEGVEVALRVAGDEMTYGPGVIPAAAPRPAHLEKALLIGLTRMGILHNLARLTASRPPDRGEGAVQEWVTAGLVRGCGSQADPLQFEVIVAGQAAGSAWLELSEAGLPRLRRQVVRFPSGEMAVTEQYLLCIAEP